MTLTWEQWARLKVGRPGRSGYADFRHERKLERAFWKWRAKRGNKGWIWCERHGYRLGDLTITMLVREVKTYRSKR